MKSKKGFVIPAIIITLAILTTAVIVVWTNWDKMPWADEKVTTTTSTTSTVLPALYTKTNRTCTASANCTAFYNAIGITNNISCFESKCSIRTQ